MSRSKPRCMTCKVFLPRKSGALLCWQCALELAKRTGAEELATADLLMHKPTTPWPAISIEVGMNARHKR